MSAALSLLQRGRVIALLAFCLGLLPNAWGADPVRGKALFNNTNGASASCSTSGCHNGFPTVKLNKIALGSSASTILSAISSNKGGMGILSAYVNSTDAADIAAYIANPASGDAGAPSISLSVSTLTFASQTVGTTSAAQTVTVSNTGTAALTFTTMTFSGTAMADYGRAGTCAPGGSVAAGSSCTVQITFTPTAAGTRSATLTLGHNATGGSSAVTLSGTAVAAAAAASVSPSSLSFTQMVSTTSSAQTVTLSNTGGSALTISSVSFSGVSAAEYATATGTTCTAGATVNGGASCVVKVAFTPTATGARNATLSIAHSAAGTPATVTLNGTGSATAVPAVALSTSALTFANQSLGTSSATQTVTLTNTGSATLTLSSLTLSGAAMADFSRTGTCAAGGNLAPAATCTLVMSFTPNAVGARSATLTVVSNASNGNALLALSGTGVQVILSASAISGMMQAQVGQRSTSASSAITSSGANTLNVSAVSVTGPFVLTTGVNACAAAPFALASGQSCNLFVAFQPTTTGTASGEIVITSNASPSTTRLTLAGQTITSSGAVSDTTNVGLGGCSMGAPDQLVDPLLAVMLVVSVLVLMRRHRRTGHGHTGHRHTGHRA